jgi:hypothetical protein
MAVLLDYIVSRPNLAFHRGDVKLFHGSGFMGAALFGGARRFSLTVAKDGSQRPITR